MPHAILKRFTFPYLLGLFLLCTSLPCSAATYLLAEPLKQTVALDTPLRKTLFGATVAADLAWTATNTLVYYQITGEPFSTAAYGVYNLVSGMAFINAEVRLQEEVLARIARRSELTAISQNPGAEEIRVLTTGYFEQTTPYTTRLHSRSFIFLESEEAPKKGSWTRIPNEKKSKVFFEMKIPNNPGSLKAWEVTLEELFDGTSIPQEILNEWEEPLNAHSNQRSLWQKWVSKKGMEGVQIEAYLMNKGEKIPFGPVATESGVFRFMNGNKIQAWNNTFRSLFQIEKKPVPVKTQNTRVVRSKGCSSWFQRLLGKEILVP
jgi:hypothetical protein